MANLLLEGKEARSKNAVRTFLHQYALGITARLTEVINDNVAKDPPAQEQQRCIRALEEMVRLCDSAIRIARPQVWKRTTLGTSVHAADGLDFIIPPDRSRLLRIESFGALLLGHDDSPSRRRRC